MKVLIGNFKGPKGDTGEKGDKGNKGDRGEQGQRGSRWESGTNITGTDTVGTKFPNSGITDAQPLDHYINSDTGNLYECSVPGTADTAEWVYIGSFKGPKGDTGLTGSISDINEQKPTYSESSGLGNLESGETVKTAFGKLKKAVSVLISHYAQKAAYNILGHVKLSNSAAVTIPGEYALDAVEKNASVEGTLANMISQTNSNLDNYIVVESRWLSNQPNNEPASLQVVYDIGMQYHYDYDLGEPPTGYKLLAGFVVAEWTSSHEWFDFFFLNYIITSVSGRAYLMINNEQKEDFTFPITCAVKCLFVKI